MKKKTYLLLLIGILSIIVTGCTKEEEKVKDISNIPESGNFEYIPTNNDKLYSDKNKIVFANGKAKLVYYYSGETITGYESYIDYEDPVAAKYAESTFEKDDSIKEVYTKDQYLVVVYNDSEYKDVTLSELKVIYSMLEEVKKGNN